MGEVSNLSKNFSSSSSVWKMNTSTFNLFETKDLGMICTGFTVVEDLGVLGVVRHCSWANLMASNRFNSVSFAVFSLSHASFSQSHWPSCSDWSSIYFICLIISAWNALKSLVFHYRNGNQKKKLTSLLRRPTRALKDLPSKFLALSAVVLKALKESVFMASRRISLRGGFIISGPIDWRVHY